jgi:queuine tRNA-ribosyltransferase
MAARDYSRAYLHHLIKANEILGAMLLTEINLNYYQTLMRQARAAVANRQFIEFCQATRDNWARGESAAF